MGDDGAFEPEGEVAGVAEERHFEELETVDIGYAVDPFGEAVIVPHFPEEAADECRQGEAKNASPVALSEFRKKGGAMDQAQRRG